MDIVVNSEDIKHTLTVVAQFKIAAKEYEIRRQKNLALIRDLVKKLTDSNKKESKDKDNRSFMMKEILLKTDGEKEELLALKKDYERIKATPNPFRDVQEIPVYNGDLKTQIYMLSEEEIKDAFGEAFNAAFSVGRVYFNNQHDDKKLIVNTTSLRAKVLYYKRPQSESIFFKSKDEKNKGKGENDKKEMLDFSTILIQDEQKQAQIEASYPPTKNEVLFFSKKLRTKIISINEEDLKAVLEKMIIKEFPQAVNNMPMKESLEAIGYKLMIVWNKLKSISESQDRYRHKTESGDLSEKVTKLFLGELFDANKTKEVLSSFQEEYFTAPPKDLLNDLNNIEKHIEEFANEINVATTDPANLSPIQHKPKQLASPTKKPIAFSPNSRIQEKLAISGYMWEDYYRPMSFESVLISLISQTKNHPRNKALKWLRSAGVLAGGLVGLTAIYDEFGAKGFAQTVAFSTGVFLPELRKRLLQDIEEYLPNLASLGLGTQFTIGPNESKDGYVFFPRGPIFAFGVDEFSIGEPSYIVNIDNVDVAVDAALVDKSFNFSSGVKSPIDLVNTATQSIYEKMKGQTDEIINTENRLKQLKLSNIVNEIEYLISEDKQGLARTALQAFLIQEPEFAKNKYLSQYEKTLINQSIVVVYPENKFEELDVISVSTHDGGKTYVGSAKFRIHTELDNDALIVVNSKRTDKLKIEFSEIKPAGAGGGAPAKNWEKFLKFDIAKDTWSDLKSFEIQISNVNNPAVLKNLQIFFKVLSSTLSGERALSVELKE